MTLRGHFTRMGPRVKFVFLATDRLARATNFLRPLTNLAAVCTFPYLRPLRDARRLLPYTPTYGVLGVTERKRPLREHSLDQQACDGNDEIFVTTYILFRSGSRQTRKRYRTVSHHCEPRRLQ